MNKTRAAIAKNGAESAGDSWYGFSMLESSTYLESKTYHSSDGDARITVTPVQRVDRGIIIDMEVSLNPDTRKGAAVVPLWQAPRAANRHSFRGT
jgi:hypothetical protein